MNIANINTLARSLAGNASSTSLTDANLLISVNKYYEQVVGNLLKETGGGSMPFGDFNYAAFPTFTTDMTAGTQSYALSSWGTALTIMGVEVKDADGDWHRLDRITFDYVLRNGGQDGYYETNGLPAEYEVRDNMMVLYPTPAAASVTVTAGLRLYFLRTADVFTAAEVTTGTKEPGFPSPWHDILSYGAAYDYAVGRGLQNAGILRTEIDRKMAELLDFVANRDQDNNDKLNPVMRSYR